MKRVVIVGPPPVQILDVTGPLEVFSNAPDYQVLLATPGDTRSVMTSRGIALGEATPLSELVGPIDTLVVVGGPGAESGVPHEELVAWLERVAPTCRRVAAICTGAFVLGQAGLLAGRRVVTHWSFCARLAQEFPEAEVCPEPIFLKDEGIYTSAGITAGIDLALALVEEDQGHEAALRIAKFLVMFLVRPGDQSQFSHMLSMQFGASRPLRELQVWIQDHLQSKLTVETLAERMGMSERHFARICHSELAMSPAHFVERLRVATAQSLIDTSTKGLKEVAAECGFSSAEVMRRAFVRTLGISAGDYAQRFGRMKG
ncbi:MAG: DJ-1/PfpI family protein [Edaphobacter sp.]|uniref:GlxA family transcriptional regulator n=1 Tax=Edaphobacter sp. TaxID=1934404 RepID=UPI00238E4649|nr:DJ-1/PfpI family protein [Edaphobacter sp.]MDE1177369.1 DJ-1/PfpI family protein [Edaphobacter sp.]